MKKIIFVFYLIGSFFMGNAVMENSANVELNTFPKDFTVVNTFDENGVLTLVDGHGNGVDIYVNDTNVDIDDRITQLKEEWVVKEILNLQNSGNELSQSTTSVFEVAVDDDAASGAIFKIILMQKNDYIIEAFFVKPENLETHSVFEEEILSVLENMKGDNNHEEAQTWNVGSFINYGGKL